MERFFEILAKYHSEKAAAHYGEAARLSSQGELEGVEAELGQANTLLEQARGVKRIQANLIAELNELGIEQPPFEYYLRKLGVSATRNRYTRGINTAEQQGLAGENGERRYLVDLGFREEKAVYTLFAINPERTGFLHESFGSVCYSLYPDKLVDLNLTDSEKRRKETSLLGSLYGIRKSLTRRFTEPSDQVGTRLSTFLEWIRTQPEYASLAMEELVLIVHRKISFQEILQKAGIKQPTDSAPLPSGTQPPVPDKPPVPGEPAELNVARIPGKDLGVRQEKLAYALFEVKADRTGFMHESFEDACRAAYVDTLQGIENPKARNNRLKLAIVSGTTARSGITEKIRGISTKPDEVPPYLGRFYNWVKAQPEYHDLGIDEIIQVLQREVTFDQLKQGGSADKTEIPIITQDLPKSEPGDTSKTIDIKFTDQEIYYLAQRIGQLGDEAAMQMGINLAAEREDIESVVRRFSEQAGSSIEEEQIGPSLLKKLSVFLQDKKTVLLANTDEDAQYSLALLSGIDSEEKLQQLLSS